MKLLKIEHPTTKNAKISRILFMVMTVLFAVYMCLLCYNDARQAMSEVKITPDAGYVLEFAGVTPLGALYAVCFAFYALAAVAILWLSLRCTTIACGVAFGLSVGGALASLLINTSLAEYYVCKYCIFFFLHHNDISTKFIYLKPTLAALTIASATYFLIARLIEHKKATAPQAVSPQETPNE